MQIGQLGGDKEHSKQSIQPESEENLSNLEMTERELDLTESDMDTDRIPMEEESLGYITVA